MIGLLAATLATTAAVLASSPATPPDHKAAAGEIEGQTITIEELEKAAPGDFLNLEVEREKILEAQLARTAAARLVSLEAKARGLSDTELLQQEVIAKVPEPSDEEIGAYYQASRDLMKEGQDKAVPRIRQALVAQRRQKAYEEFLERLKVKYGFKSFLRPIRAHVDAATGPVRGPAHAPVTLVEFSDFQCPYCAALTRTLADVLKRYPDQVKVVFRQFPLEHLHPDAMRAAQSSVCAQDQGKFWEMHDQLFKGGGLSEDDIAKKATAAGLDADAFKACLADAKTAERVKADMDAGVALGITSTPSFFINGRPLRGAMPYQEVVKVIDEELRAAGKTGNLSAAVAGR